MTVLKTSFALTVTKRKSSSKITKERRNTIDDICRGINQLAWELLMKDMIKSNLTYAKISPLRYISTACKNLSLEDKSGNVIDLSYQLFKPKRFGLVQLIIGNIIEINYYTKKQAYIMCTYYIGMNSYNMCVIANREQVEQLDARAQQISNNRIICGTIITMEEEAQKKYSYNARTHTSYMSQQTKTVIRNYLMQFTILPATKQGIVCENLETLYKLETECEKDNLFFWKTKNQEIIPI